MLYVSVLYLFVSTRHMYYIGVFNVKINMFLAVTSTNRGNLILRANWDNKELTQRLIKVGDVPFGEMQRLKRPQRNRKRLLKTYSSSLTTSKALSLNAKMTFLITE